MIGFSFEKESYCLEVKISPSIRNVQGNTVLHKSMCNSTWLLRGDDRVQLRDGKLIGDKDKPKHKQRPGEHCIVAIKRTLRHIFIHIPEYIYTQTYIDILDI